jgi:hypothetical protein
MAVRDYSKGKIYKIVVDTDEEYKPYVGSTIQGLAERMGGHRSSYKTWKKNKTTKCNSFDLFDKFGLNKCKIILIEEYPCENISQLIMKEREWFDKIECCNLKRPFVSKDEKKINDKLYYEENKEQISDKVKLYRNKNKEEITKKNKIYREANKEQICEKKKEKFECNCGSICRKNEKARHERSQKHQNWLGSL